jgi:TolA-binding protein
MDADYLVQGTFAGSAEGIKVRVEVLEVASGKVIGTADQLGKADEVIEVEARLVTAVTGALKLDKPATRQTSPTGGKSVTLAILYLQNLSPDAKLDPMEVGFTDTLITYLQDRPGVSVVERDQLNKVLEELGLQKSALGESGESAKIGRMLGAQVLLLGSYLVTKDRIRFDAHLVSADTGMLIQAVSASGSTADLEASVRTLADRTAAALAARPRKVSLAEHKSKTSLEAMLHYSQGLDLENQQRFDEAKDEFQRSIYLAPDNIEIQVKLGELYYWHTHEYSKAAEILEPIVMSDSHYLRLDGELLSWSFNRCGKEKECVAILKRMFNDSSLQKEQRSRIAFWIAKSDHGAAVDSEKYWYEQALGLAADANWHANMRNHLAQLYQEQGDSKNETLQYEAILTEIPPDDVPDRHFFVMSAVQALGGIYKDQHDYDRAKTIFRQVGVRFRNTDEAAISQFQLGKVAEAAGRMQEAIGLYETFAQDHPQLENAPEALLNAAWLIENGSEDKQHAQELVRRVVIHNGSVDADRYYGTHVGILRALPRRSLAPFESDHPRPALLDEAHCEASIHDTGGGAFAPIACRAALMKEGYWAHSSQAVINQRLLSGYSILVLSSAYAGGAIFSNEEIEAIRNYVASGGSLLIFVADSRAGEGTDYLQYGPLLSAFGAGLYRSAPSNGEAISVEAKHDISKNARRAVIDDNVSVSVPPQTVFAMSNGRPVLCGLQFGLGRLIVSGTGFDDTVYKQVIEGLSEPNAASSKAPFLDAVFEWLRAAEDKNNTRSAFESAMRKFAEGDESAALSALHKIVVDNAETRWAEEAKLLAMEFFREKGDLLAASTECQELLVSTKDPQIKALARLNLARCYAAPGGLGTERALVECWKVWKDDQSNPWAAPALIEGGQWAYKAGDVESAQKAFDEVMNSREHSTDKLKAMLWSALCREKRGDAAGAARIYSAIDVEYPAFNMAVPAEGRVQDVRQYARKRAQELRH